MSLASFTNKPLLKSTSRKRSAPSSTHNLPPSPSELLKRRKTTTNKKKKTSQFSKTFMKRRNQRQTPNNNNNNDRSNKVSSRKSFSGLETLFSSATSMKKKKKSTKTPARFAETFARRQAKQKAPAFPNNSKNKTNHTTNTTTTATNNRSNSRPSQQPFTPSDTRNVASVYLAKYTSTKKSNNSTTNNIHNIIEESPGFNVPSSQQIHVDTFESQDESSNNNNNHNNHNHNHNSSQDLDFGVPSSQPLLPSVVINEQEDVIDAHPEEMVEEQDLYAPPESALYSSKKTKRSSTNGIFPMSPSATPRYAGSFNQFASSSSSSSSSTSNNISTKTSTMSGFPPPPPQVRMNAAAAAAASSSSSSSAFSSFSPSSRSMQGGRSSWKVTVDKSLALSSVGGGQIHRALAQSPGSALKTSAGAAWSGKGSSGGRGGSRRAGVGSSYLDRHRTKIRSGKYGKLAQQLLDMQDDVGRKIEQLKALEFQQTHQSSNNSKSQFISRRSDPRTGRFVEIKVCTITTLKTGHFTARCERTDISVPSKNKYSKHSNSNEYSNEYANESDSNEMEEDVPLLPTMEVDLIMNSKRAKSIHVTSGCILRLYEPWLELASHMRQHKQNDYNVVDLLIASDVVVKV